MIRFFGNKLLLSGEAGTETYPFRRDTCRVFRSFIHEGKLTVCTPGMRHQVGGRVPREIQIFLSAGALRVLCRCAFRSACPAASCSGCFVM